jgi:IS5 family transposase
MGLPEDTEVLADKGYCSQENENRLCERHLVSKIMRKKKKNQPADAEFLAYNYEISKEC